MSLRGPYKVVLRWLKFDRGGLQQPGKLKPLQRMLLNVIKSDKMSFAFLMLINAPENHEYKLLINYIENMKKQSDSIRLYYYHTNMQYCNYLKILLF